MTAYYNEFDKYAAQWLRNLIQAGHIAPGDVDERSIEDVKPDDLTGYTQCHFFAGVGVWSLALRRAGWDDTRPVWTASCPCQPFSAAGAGAGFADERHLWPTLEHLVRERRPAILIGEQVASKDADPWIDLVHTDLEALGYAVGAVAFPSAGVGAPHIRDRQYWVGLADAGSSGLSEQRRGWVESARLAQVGELGGLADAERARVCGEPGVFDSAQAGAGNREYLHNPSPGGHVVRPGPTNGYWRDADWLGCTDGKWRPVEPGAFPLVNGAPSRVGRLRAYGNAINAEAARIWIETVMECMP